MHQPLEPDQVFKLLFEATPHAYLIVLPDDSYTVVAVNDRYLAAVGRRRAELLGRGLFECLVDGPAIADLRASLQRVVSERVEDVVGMQRYDLRWGSGDGARERYWSVVNTPAFDRHGKVAYIIHHADDVSEFVRMRQRTSERPIKGGGIRGSADHVHAEILRRAIEVKKTNRQLKSAKQALERRESEYARLCQRLAEQDRAKTEFFANVSHEFRTPLTLMLGPLEELLAQTEQASPGIHGSLLLLHRNAVRLLKLVNTLLEFSRIEANRAQPDYRPTDLALLTADLASNFRSACESAGLFLLVDCPPLPRAVLVDRDMWEKVVLNLLSNAFKFTMEGGIEIKLKAAGSYAELTVRDSGTGIAESDLPHLFERFYRARQGTSLSHEGAGIGLALVKELVQLHDGTVGVESSRGVGSTFTVRIPMRFAPGSAEEANGLASRPGRAAPAFVTESRQWRRDSRPQAVATAAGGGADHRDRILLAEDNADMRGYISHLLEDAGYRVEAVPDGEAALANCLAHPPDLVLCDVTMPRLNGFEILRRLRANAAVAAVPVILLSARAGEDAKIEGFAAGADDYLTKPFTARTLLARIDSAIRVAEIRRQVAEHERQIAVLEACIAEQKEAALALRVAKEEAEAARRDAELANQTKSRFLAAASHDLRQPLQGLFLFAARLAGSNLGAKERKMVASIERALESLKLLLDGLLDVSKLDAGIIIPEVRDVAANEVLDVIAAEYQERAAERRIGFKVANCTTMVRTDPTLLVRLLRNLLENALRFTERGRILLICRKRTGHLLLQVWDTGQGIPEEMLGEIFEEFVQVGNAERDREQGLGLGLAIVNRLSRLLGHPVSVRSVLGRGSVFSVELPLALSPAALASAVPPIPAQAVENGACAVVIDDDAMVNFGLTALLENWGYMVISARSAEDAIQQLTATRAAPWVLIADYRLPRGETGLDAVAQLRRQVRTDLPAILLTGDTSPGVLRDVRASGLPVLHKPVLASELRQKLEQLSPRGRPSEEP